MPKVNFVGLELRNPVIVASATPSIMQKLSKELKMPVQVQL